MKLGDINVCTEAMHEHNEYGEGESQHIDTLRVPPPESYYLTFLYKYIGSNLVKLTNK